MAVSTILQQIKWKSRRSSDLREIANVHNVDWEGDSCSTLKTMIEAFGLPEFEEDLPPEQLCLKLLQAAAEIEHGLLVEYLYSASSVKNDLIRTQILTVAIQEMGHLITVQNLILFMGGNPYYGRLDNSSNTDFIPFPFALEPLTKTSLQKYVIAEMPELSKLDTATQHIINEIISTKQGALHVQFHRVGIIYSYLYWLFQSSDVPEGPWKIDPAGLPAGKHVKFFPGAGTEMTTQADPADTEWNASFGGGGMVFELISKQEDALSALSKIATQGEGLEPEDNSHFEAFLAIHNQWNELGDQVSLNLPINPTIESQAIGTENPNLITDPLAVLWIKLHNLRYNILLKCLTGTLLISRVDGSIKNNIRVTLITWSLQEMKLFLKRINTQIVGRPRKAGGNNTTDPASPVYSIMSPVQVSTLQDVLSLLLDLSQQSNDTITQILASPGISTLSKLEATQLQQQNLKRIASIKEFQQQILVT